MRRTEYWNWTETDYGNPADRRRPVYPVLKKLASEKGLRRVRAHHRQHGRRDRFHRQKPACQGLVVRGMRSTRDDQRKRERA